MLVRPWLVGIAFLAWAASASAMLNRSVMVPVYKPCTTGAANCFPPVRASTYTFDSIYLYSSPKPYTKNGQLALMVVIKGLRDAAGNLVNATLKMPVPKSRVVLLDSLGTFQDGLELQAPYLIEVKNGAARARFPTEGVPESGLIVNTVGSPIILDPEGNELATTGVRTKD